jgi:2-methylcitrate dehydratase PrpD
MNVPVPAVTRQLAEFVARQPLRIASSAAVREVRRALLDLLGVTVRGAAEPAGRIALSYAKSQSSDGKAGVIGGGVRLSPSLASLVNGTSGHALDFDDIGLGAGHVSVAIMPAVLAVAESIDASGGAFVDAMVLGYEVAHRLTTMYADTRLGPYAVGYHKPSIYSVFGGTAAVARLLELDADATQHALGIAASEAGGLRVNFGTMTKPLHAGLANRAAVEAALLAQSGFTASPEALEGRFGWHEVVCRGEGDLATVVRDLGAPFAIEEGLIYKAYPCCGANHYAIDGVIRLMSSHDLSGEDVEQIDVTIESRSLNDVLIYPWPRTPLEGKFSLAYNVAAAMVDGTVTVDTFTDEALGRLSAARDRVHVHASPDLPQNAAFVELRTTDGRTLSRRQDVLRGSLDDPMSWDELVAKFVANASGLVKDTGIMEVVEQIESLGEGTSFRQLTSPLVDAVIS